MGESLLSEFTIVGVGCDMKPVEEHAKNASQDLDRCVGSGCAATHQQPNAIAAQPLAFFQRNVVGRGPNAVLLHVQQGFLARLKVQWLGLAQQTDHRLYHMHLHLRVHLPGWLQAAMHHMITTTARVVTIAVTLGAIANGMIAIETGAFGRKAYGEGRLLVGATVLVLAHHRHLLHGMQYIAKFQIRMLPMYLVGALNAQIQRRRTVLGIGDANAVIIAYFGCLSITSIGTVFALTGEWNQVICTVGES